MSMIEVTQSANYSLTDSMVQKSKAINPDTQMTHLCRVVHSSHGRKNGMLLEGRKHKVDCMQALLLAPTLRAPQPCWLLNHAHTRLQQR